MTEEKLKLLLTDEFLDTLLLSVEQCNWSVDYIESAEFVKWCFKLAGKDLPRFKGLFSFED